MTKSNLPFFSLSTLSPFPNPFLLSYCHILLSSGSLLQHDAVSTAATVQSGTAYILSGSIYMEYSATGSLNQAVQGHHS